MTSISSRSSSSPSWYTTCHNGESCRMEKGSVVCLEISVSFHGRNRGQNTLAGPVTERNQLSASDLALSKRLQGRQAEADWEGRRDGGEMNEETQ